jgi:hypothetical protein
MSTKKHIEQEVKKTMESLDGIEPATTDAFFYSRLTAKLENRISSDIDSQISKDYGFAFSIAAVFLVLVLNLVFISQYSSTTDTLTNREEVIEELAYEYQVFDLNYYETYEAE